MTGTLHALIDALPQAVWLVDAATLRVIGADCTSTMRLRCTKRIGRLSMGPSLDVIGTNTSACSAAGHMLVRVINI